MRSVNRILMVLVVLLTIGSAVLGFLLYQNRNLMRERADSLAEGMAGMVQSLDQESQTEVARRVNFQFDPATGTESGSLSWDRFREEYPDTATLNNAVETANRLAEQINTQRNQLALALANVAEVLGSDEANLARLLTNASPQSYEANIQKITRLAEAGSTRTNDIIDTLAAIAQTVDVNLQRADFFRRRQERDDAGDLVAAGFEHQGALQRVQTAVNTTVSARDNYRDALVSVITEVGQHNWSVTPGEVRDRNNYERALALLVNDLQEINAELVRSGQRQQEIARLQDEVTTTRDRLQLETEQRREVEQQVQAIRHDVEETPETIQETRIDPRDVQALFPREARGQVLNVNPQFGFVIIDLGREDQVNPGLELLVDRDGEFVARLRVTEVTQEFAVADVVPRIRVENVREGDQVMAP